MPPTLDLSANRPFAAARGDQPKLGLIYQRMERGRQRDSSSAGPQSGFFWALDRPPVRAAASPPVVSDSGVGSGSSLVAEAMATQAPAVARAIQKRAVRAAPVSPPPVVLELAVWSRAVRPQPRAAVLRVGGRTLHRRSVRLPVLTAPGVRLPAGRRFRPLSVRNQAALEFCSLPMPATPGRPDAEGLTTPAQTTAARLEAGAGAPISARPRQPAESGLVLKAGVGTGPSRAITAH